MVDQTLPNPDQPADLTWRDAVPVSTRFDDPYYSLDNGLAETRHVFLTGNDLPQRFRDGFHIAELGFGTGLNLLAALQMWRDTRQTGQLQFSTFEAFPLPAADMIRAQAAFPEVAQIAAELAPFWHQSANNGGQDITLPDLRFRLIAGDARVTLPRWQDRADAWFLDGFSPAKNPELWEHDLLHQVARHTAQQGTLASYSAAGHVRRTLAQAGLEVTRAPGYGRKRHMTTARLP